MIGTFDDLLKEAARSPVRCIAVAAPSSAETFAAIAGALERLPARFVLVGDGPAIERGTHEAGCDPARIRIEATTGAASTLGRVIGLAQEGEAGIIMKGGVDTASLMRSILDEASGLRTGRLLSDVFIFEYPPRQGNRFVMITDGGVTTAPDLKAKVELINNAVEVAHRLGNRTPRVAVLSATEYVTTALASTVDAACLAKMNDRGQIKGCIVDGPLALDNALSAEAAEEKGIGSAVAGRAEILVAPSIEAANSLAKGTTYFGGLRQAHVIVGAKVPILIPSRADKSDARLLSMALGMIMCGPISIGAAG